MPYMDLRRTESEIEMRLFEFTHALVRHTPYLSSQSLSYYLHTIFHNPYLINPALRSNQTTLTTFVRLPPKTLTTMSSSPPPQPPNPIPAAAGVPVYNHNDPVGMVKYTRSLDISERRPDPLPPPPLPSAPHLSMTDERKP